MKRAGRVVLVVSRKITQNARGSRADSKKFEKTRKWTWTNMAGGEGDDLASLDAKAVNESAVVELIRRRFSCDKIYVSRALLARSCKNLFVFYF